MLYITGSKSYMHARTRASAVESASRTLDIDPKLRAASSDSFTAFSLIAERALEGEVGWP
jgi:hypothetical protein